MRRLHIVSLIVVVMHLWLASFVEAVPLIWEDHPVAPIRGTGVEIERAPTVGTYGIVDAVGTGIRYMEGSGDSWSVTTISTSTHNSAPRLGLAYHPLTGNPYVSYQEVQAQVLQSVSYYDGVNWTSETVASSGACGGSSLAFDPATSQPVVVYGGSGQPMSSELIYAWCDATGWHSETIDSGFGSFHSPSLRFDPLTGEPCVAYSHDFNGAYFARRTGPGLWDIAQVEALTFPYHTVLDFNPATGMAGLVYDTGILGSARYAEFNGSDWDTWQVSTLGHKCNDVGLAYLADGTPMVAYTASSLSSVPASGTSFHIAWMPDDEFSILSEHSYGQWNWNGPLDLAIDAGSLHVAYQATNIGTHYATGTVIPEPATCVLFGAGLIGLVGYARRRRRKV